MAMTAANFGKAPGLRNRIRSVPLSDTTTTHIHHERRQHVLPLSLLSTPQSPTSIAHALLTIPQVASQTLRPRRNPLLSPRFAALQKSFLSTEVRSAIDKAVASAPVVLFMKGTPETPQCGFSRAAIQILGLQGVNPQKFTAFNVLEDEELRAGTLRKHHKSAMLCDSAKHEAHCMPICLDVLAD
jgi:hypothetical protein